MTDPTNYAAFGEYTAYRLQAQRAESTRFSVLNNLGADLRRAADCIDEAQEFERWRARLDQAEAAVRERDAALARANQAAALCGEPELKHWHLSPRHL